MNLIKKKKFFKLRKSSFVFTLHSVNQNFSGYEMETGNFTVRHVNLKNFRFTKWKLEIIWFTLRKLEKFPVYEMKTGNVPIYVT